MSRQKPPDNSAKPAAGKAKSTKPGSKPTKQPNKQATEKRAYNSPVREKQSAETREKIITAGAELVHGYLAWDWKNLNALAVAKQAGVGKRTVQRYFPSESMLRDAVLQRIVEESGVELASIKLADFADTVASIFRYLQSFSVTHVYPYDSTFKSLDDLRRDVLLQVVATATPKWSDNKRVMAAAMLDMFWQPLVYERLTTTWGLGDDDAVSVLTWMIKSIQSGIQNDQLPEPSSED